MRHQRRARSDGEDLMRKIVILALALASCATPPAPQIVTKEVKVPVPVACVDKALIPPEPEAVLLPLADARQAADIAAAQALKYKAYARELYALIVPACTQ